MASKSRTTTDHEEIRRWAEERGGQPAEVERTERNGETGIIRIDFPGFSGAGSLKKISWDEWFQKFDDAKLALVYQETTARGQKSNFNKIVGRETASARARGDSSASRRSIRGGRGGGSRTRRSTSRGTAAKAGGARRTRIGATGTKRTRRGATARSGRASGTRAAPRAAAARVTGRKGAAGARGTSSRGGATARARAGAKGGRKTTARKSAGRTPRRGGRSR